MLTPDTHKIKRALISVSDKSGIVEFAKQLAELGIEIYSTGGTMKTIAEAGIPDKSISDLTGFPEIMDGRVKTLHPKIHAGLLAVLDNSEHVKQMEEDGLVSIDLLVVNLYPFEAALEKKLPHEEMIENIDIGGPGMLRAAAKNYLWTAPVTNPGRYDEIINMLKTNGTIDENYRLELAADVFTHTAYYDSLISDYLRKQSKAGEPVKFSIPMKKLQDLRYGENPHQKGIFYGNLEEVFEQLHGKAISYNNLLDLDAAINLISDFEETTFAITKHNNACGLASREKLVDAWRDALAGDPVSAFGGVLITNRTVDEETAAEINKIFFEIILAPDYDEKALEILKTKKNRIILKKKSYDFPENQYRSLLNGVLTQDKDLVTETPEDLKTVTEISPNQREIEDLLFANKIVKHTKSNTIVLAKNKQLVGSGTGQTSRVDALKQAIEKARAFELDLDKAVMASDAFFPFADSVEIANKAGIGAVIQPGGSIRDADSINYCDEHGMAMVFTGRRHFKH